MSLQLWVDECSGTLCITYIDGMAVHIKGESIAMVRPVIYFRRIGVGDMPYAAETYG